MPIPDQLPSEILDHIAEEVQVLLPRVLEDAAILSAREVALDETLAVWALGADAIGRDAPLAELAVGVSRWHHQVTFDGKALAFVRSSVKGSSTNDATVEEIYSSDIAGAIATGLSWVEENIKTNALVRLLIIPAYFIHSLWLHNDKDSVIVVDRPAAAANLKTLHPYDEDDFLQILRTFSRVEGIVP